MINQKIAGVVLAAGEGTRMKSHLPKVLHEVKGKPMIKHVIDNLAGAGVNNIVIVIGYGAQQVKEALGNQYRQALKYVYQEKRLGTAHAVMCAEPILFSKADRIVVMYGDTPFFKSETIKNLISVCIEKEAALSMVTFEASEPSGYGRVITDSGGHVKKIVEEKDATFEEKKIREVNAGCYCFEASFLWENLPKVRKSEATGEYYLTDLIEIANSQNKKVVRLKIREESEAWGINTPEQLKKACEMIKKNEC